MSKDQLMVFLNSLPAGVLERDTGGSMSFNYGAEAKHRLSIAMPLREQTFDNQACDSYFGGLLPESEKARNAIARKYNANPDNTFSLLKAITQSFAKPLDDRLRLLRYLIFNFLVMNADAHAKNFSLLHTQRSVKLAPLYDILTIPIYDDMEQSMAMSIGNTYDFKTADPDEWHRLSKAIGISTKLVRKELRQQVNSIMGGAEEERDDLQKSPLKTYEADNFLLLL